MKQVSRVRAALGWLPLGLLAALVATGWTVFLRGGFRSILAWLAISTVVPLVAVVLVLGTIVRTALAPRATTRRARLAATIVLGAFAAWPAAWQVGLAGIAFPFDRTTTTPAPVVRLPTDATMRVAWGGDDLAHNRHAMLPDQRWAYDLTVEPAFVGSKRVEDYGCWGVPVVAPIAAVVHLAHDGEPDQEPGLPREIAKPLGNHVALRLGGGGYLLLAHLRRGSVVVREGDRVEEGAEIGQCGNSGHTSEPHVHVHAQRQDPRGRPINFSEGLPLTFRDHDGPATMPLGGLTVKEGHVVATGMVIRHTGAAGRTTRATP